MNTSEEFQALKPHYFAWLESPEQTRAGLLAQLATSLEPRQLQALQSLIAHTHLMPSSGTNASGQSERIGALYGPFRIATRIGSGGMGEVYLANRIEGGFSQQVALKLVRAEFASPALIQRFNREREILARLSHPNIAGLVDGGLTGGLPWFAMAYVDGVSLWEYVRAHQPGTPQKLALALQMADALIEAHRKLVIHRDLKPSNILVTQTGIVKLLDFGIGKILDNSDAAQTLTGPTPMTIRYASPEQLAGEATSISTDIYQLGLVLSELLLGTPIRAEAELANARSLAVDVRAVLRQALAAAPTQRYASASEFASDLRRLLAREPVQAMPARLGYRVQRFMTRNRALSLSLVFATLALAAGVASSLWQATQARQNADTLLRLLNVAAPQTFVGKEPPLVDYLVNSAKQLETDLANQPEFLARALTEIGNGRINLNRETAAQQVLQKAHAAALRARFDAEHELPILRLLAYTMEPPTPLAAVQSLSKRITEKLTESPSGAGLNALATITNSLSKQGDTASVQTNLVRISTLRASIKLAPQDLENLLRQIGKIAQREGGFKLAVDYFTEACQLYENQAALFSPMRIAEGYSLLAGAALKFGDIVKAEQARQRAEPEFMRSYAKDDEPMREFLILGKQIRVARSLKLVE